MLATLRMPNISIQTSHRLNLIHDRALDRMTTLEKPLEIARLLYKLLVENGDEETLISK